jgi:hypothetical protein
MLGERDEDGASVISSISDSSMMVALLLFMLEVGVVGIGDETEEAQSLEADDRRGPE